MGSVTAFVPRLMPRGQGQSAQREGGRGWLTWVFVWLCSALFLKCRLISEARGSQASSSLATNQQRQECQKPRTAPPDAQQLLLPSPACLSPSPYCVSTPQGSSSSLQKVMDSFCCTEAAELPGPHHSREEGEQLLEGAAQPVGTAGLTGAGGPCRPAA